jgi:hypothetical protein
LNRLRPLALATALACAGSASAAPSPGPAPEVRSLASTNAKSPLANKAAVRMPEPRHHHEVRGTLMPDGTVKLDCEQVPGSVDRTRRVDAPLPTEPK